MYLIVGYGSQEGGGYSIRVNDLYLGRAVSLCQHIFGGPGIRQQNTEKDRSGTVSFPYIVIKLETMDAPVIFDI